MSERVAVWVAAALGVEVRSTRPLGGGMIGSVVAAMVADGTEVVAKTSEGVPLTVEASMLRYLKERSELPVPDVLHADDDLLVLEMLPGTAGACAATEPHAAELLARLHVETADRFGFGEDTLIGPFVQPNVWSDDWPTFFGEHRLRYVAGIASDRGELPAEDARRVDAVIEALPELLAHDPSPSLLHGDVWSGNVLCQGDRVTGLLDPAIYFGDREVELAFIELFGTFGESFFRRYEELAGLRAGFRELRCDIYQLYPLLVHVAAFGSGYLGGLRHRLSILEQHLELRTRGPLA